MESRRQSKSCEGALAHPLGLIPHGSKYEHKTGWFSSSQRSFSNWSFRSWVLAPEYWPGSFGVGLKSLISSIFLSAAEIAGGGLHFEDPSTRQMSAVVHSLCGLPLFPGSSSCSVSKALCVPPQSLWPAVPLASFWRPRFLTVGGGLCVLLHCLWCPPPDPCMDDFLVHFRAPTTVLSSERRQLTGSPSVIHA